MIITCPSKKRQAQNSAYGLLTSTTHVSLWKSCTVSPNGDCIVSASDDRTLKVRDASTGGEITTFHAEHVLMTCAFLPDREHLVADGSGGFYFLRLVW
jgi:WD40 repeat protein